MNGFKKKKKRTHLHLRSSFFNFTFLVASILSAKLTDSLLSLYFQNKLKNLLYYYNPLSTSRVLGF